MDRYDLPETRPRRWFILTVTPQCEVAVARRIKRRFSTVVRDWASLDLAGEHVATLFVPQGKRAAAIVDVDDEDRVCDEVSTFVPISTTKVRRQGQSVAIRRIVFPRYLFVGFASAPAWFDVLAIDGVGGVIGYDGEPFEIKAETVGEIASKCWSGFYQPAVEPMIQRGMRVVARSGRFRGLEGDVAWLDRARQRADVLMTMLGSTPIRVSVDDLVSVSYSETRTIGGKCR